MAPHIKQHPESSSWSSMANHVLLTARQNFPSGSDFPSSPGRGSNGLHPAAIFGIVAGVMFFIIIASWIVWFCLIKKALTHRDYGVLPSIRTAANRHGHGHGHPGSGNYPQYGPGGGYQYGNGNSATQYPPAAHHGGNHTPPPYDWNRHAEQGPNGHKDENRGNDSHGMSTPGNGYSGPN